ncbi:glycosyltransferase family 9 protein [Actinobacillus genomosp. 1]|uniref:glycosyltransferase family 9 protein n=1 Tax=Actinobacillus genomosp. 1 TaxID=254839 RepID=UPI002442C404|nr:glycosyltransferase family 9 protein [Actinobacillus genomosp. 1]WGE36472.1 glycosyltransferase family 9 protein [Actinobacillus genomosp. 1]
MKKILVVRNDKIGDFMVCFPAFAMLKQSMPNVEITALVPSYTAPLAELCPSIDNIIIDTPNKKDNTEFNRVLQAVKNAQFDAVICFVSDWYNAKLTWKSGIKYRLAPATKVFQFLYNQRLTQRRSQSAKAESEYNLDLTRAFLQKHHIAVVEPKPPYLQFSENEIVLQKAKLAKHLQISTACKWLFVHASTGGSATSLSIEQYAQMLNCIAAETNCEIVLTAGKGESEKAHQLAAKITATKAVVYDKNDGLQDFTRSIACADLFIAGSTGPLHIAGALNVPTIGFYPSRLSALPRRWRPINAEGKHLAFMPPEAKTKVQQMNLGLISIPEALKTIVPFVKNIWNS